MRFEWDPSKDKINRAKHGVSFEDAAELLAGDADYVEIYDLDHSLDEDRFIAVGSTRLGILVVVYVAVHEDVSPHRERPEGDAAGEAALRSILARQS
jgi:uncharacterized DUF497 family protein